MEKKDGSSYSRRLAGKPETLLYVFIARNIACLAGWIVPQSGQDAKVWGKYCVRSKKAVNGTELGVGKI